MNIRTFVAKCVMLKLCTLMEITIQSPQKLKNRSSFYSKRPLFFPIEKFLTSSPQNKIPLMQALMMIFWQLL